MHLPGDRFGSEIQANPVLACDNDPECQDHIKAMGETKILFNDVGEVAAGCGVNKPGCEDSKTVFW